MTLEKLQQIRTAAKEMVGEIEWVGLFGSGDDSDVRALMKELLGNAQFVALVNDVLDTLCDFLTQHLDKVGGHQEVELEAAGMVKSALKKALTMVSPASGMMLRALPFTAKFRRLPLPTTQAPPDWWVPSLAEQRAGATPVPPAAGGAA